MGGGQAEKLGKGGGVLGGAGAFAGHGFKDGGGFAVLHQDHDFDDGGVVHLGKNAGGGVGGHFGVDLGQFFEVGGFLDSGAGDGLVKFSLQDADGLGGGAQFDLLGLEAGGEFVELLFAVVEGLLLRFELG